MTDSPAFILGVERSASTWLTNIIDSSPHVDALMEPMAEGLDLFRDVPGRLQYVSEPGDRLLEAFRDGLEETRRAKIAALESRESSPLTRRALLEFNAFVSQSVGRLTAKPPRDAYRYMQLNLPRLDNPEVLRFEKASPVEWTVIKELRLNFKTSLIERACSDTKVVVIIRNPFSQVDSMCRLFERDSLHQLRSVLTYSSEAIREQRRFDSFVGGLDEVDRDGLIERAVVYWFANYGVLLEDLARRGIDHHVVRHEDLAASPHAETAEIFDFLGIEVTEQTTEYLGASTSGAGSGRSPTDTSRDSRSHVFDVLETMPTARLERIRAAADAFWPSAPETITRYRDWLEQTL